MAWYVVFRGRVPGVYSSWAMANAQVTGFPNNCHQSFPTRDEAEAAYLEFSGGDGVPLLDNPPPQAQHGVVNHSPCLVYVCIVLCVGLLVLVLWLIIW